MQSIRENEARVWKGDSRPIASYKPDSSHALARKSGQQVEVEWRESGE